LSVFYSAITVSADAYTTKIYAPVPILHLDRVFGWNNWKFVLSVQANEILNTKMAGVAIRFGNADGSVGYTLAETKEVTNLSGSTKGYTLDLVQTASEIKALALVGPTATDARCLVTMARGAGGTTWSAFNPCAMAWVLDAPIVDGYRES